MKRNQSQLQLELSETEENSWFLTEQLITYIGNKRTLLGFIGLAVEKVKERLCKQRLMTLDMFSGSGVVARFLKKHSSRLIVNDLEEYCEIINRCYLSNKSQLDLDTLKRIHKGLTSKLNSQTLRSGIISKHYSPEDDKNIQPGERVFYTSRNARYLDTARQLIDTVPTAAQCYFLAPLLSEASVHANTSGVFKGFYKNPQTGIGDFGGRNGDALLRIKGDIGLPFPIFSNFECPVEICRTDANELASQLDFVDLAYIDPPYNQHPYGSNYFMLNLLVDYREPAAISKVSGIPDDWNRSDYNKRNKASDAFSKLVRGIKAKYLLVSFNSEGFISQSEMLDLLSSLGKVELMETEYNTFRGSRNLGKRNIHVKEYLCLVERSTKRSSRMRD